MPATNPVDSYRVRRYRIRAETPPTQPRNSSSVGKAVGKKSNTMNTDVKEIPVDQIEPVFRRAREKAGWEGLRDDIKDRGLRMPVGVMDLGRVNKDGIRYKLVYGEGRTLAADALKWPTITARILGKLTEQQFVGQFFTENVLRDTIPWSQKGQILKDEIKAGNSLKDICADLHISVDLGKRYIAVIDKTAPELSEKVNRMGINVAEKLTRLPAAGQKIVIDLAEAEKQDVSELTKKAEKLEAKGKGWTLASLRKEIQDTKDKLKKSQDTLKVLRRDFAIGPDNILKALRLPTIAKAMRAAGIKIQAEDLQIQ